MSVDYDKLAQRYDDHRRGGGPYLPDLVRLATDANARTVLEIGAGTGNNTAAFLSAYPTRVAGLDRSREMLRRGRAKVPDAWWVRGDGRQLPFATGAFDFVFGVLVLHYFTDLEALFRECARVVDTGAAVFVTAPQSFIQNHPLNAYFPSFEKIDSARFQPEEEVAEALKSAGFRDVGMIPCTADPVPIDAKYVERIEGKFISTFELLDEEEFRAGVAALRREVGEKGRLAQAMQWQAVTVWGRR